MNTKNIKAVNEEIIENPVVFFKECLTIFFSGITACLCLDDIHQCSWCRKGISFKQDMDMIGFSIHF